MAKQSKNKYYNYSKDSQTLFYRNHSDHNINAFFHMISTFIQLDDVAAFILNDKHEIFRFNDVQREILDNDFFIYYDSHLKKSLYPLELLTLYFQKKDYSHVCALESDSEMIGYIVFRKKQSVFIEEEKRLLEHCSRIYSRFYLNFEQHSDLNFEQSIYHMMINNIDSHVYISDPNTYEILFMNDSMKKTYHLDNPVGMKCWEVLQNGRKIKCNHCPVPYLIENPKKKRSWEEHSSFNKKVYLNQDCMIEWFDHSLAHFQHSIDITDLKKATFDATYDELTGIFNRKCGKSKLTEQLANASKDNKDIIVCLYDLNNLKLTNDTYGHIEGDYMLKTIASYVSETIGENDVFFRLSGDEFIVSFYDKAVNEVNLLMRNILIKLKKHATKEKLKYNLSFCFGLYLVQHHCSLTVNEIITKADEKMYEWKKKLHLRNAQFELNTRQSFDDIFKYDEHLLYDALVKSTDDYIFICNMKTGVFKYTPAMAEEFDFPSDILHNAAAIFGSKVHKDDKYEFLNSNQQITDGKTDNHIVEYRALNKNNEWVWLRCRGQVEYDDEDQPSVFAGFISNLGKKNYRDILTGLYNKFEFKKRISEIKGEFSIMLLNIDDFKSINSLFDREFGDDILRIIAQNLQTILAKDCIVFKLDGDEFGLIIKKAGQNDLKNIYQKIKNYTMQQHTYEEKSYSFSISAGCVSSPIDGDNYLTLQRNCEIALQYGKLHKRGELTQFNEKIFSEKTHLLILLSALKQDMNNDFANFYLVYQPIIDLQYKEIRKVEALCRWSHGDFNNIGPGIFIPLLEDSGDIIKLGKWIFDSAVKQIKELSIYDSNISVSINVSYIQLVEDDFVSFVEKVISDYNVPYKSIVIELTETSIVKNTDLIIEKIICLRKLGIQIAMDDFGTGYSSLSLLKDEPLDIIKIDQSFIRGIENNLFNQTFIKLIIELCHQINLSVLIEGIETKNELDLLLPLKPDFIQGYYTGKPMLTSQLLELLKKEKVC